MTTIMAYTYIVCFTILMLLIFFVIKYLKTSAKIIELENSVNNYKKEYSQLAEENETLNKLVQEKEAKIIELENIAQKKDIKEEKAEIAEEKTVKKTTRKTSTKSATKKTTKKTTKKGE